jgi:hypothetical protein
MSDKCVVCEKNEVEPLWDITCRPCSDDWNEYIKETMVDDSEIVELSIVWAANRTREKLKAIEVASCKSCPFFEYVREMNATIPVCKKKGEFFQYLKSDHVPPDWCPLRENPVLIQIATRQFRRTDKPGESQED